MKKHIDPHLNKIIAEAMNEDHLESPSIDFTHSVLAKIENISLNRSIVYQPLISKKAWLLIFGVFAFYIMLVLQLIPEDAGFSLYSNKLFQENILNYIPSITLSKNIIYALMFTSIMILFQLPLLQYYFNKRLSL